MFITRKALIVFTYLYFYFIPKLKYYLFIQVLRIYFIKYATFIHRVVLIGITFIIYTCIRISAALFYASSGR